MKAELVISGLSMLVFFLSFFFYEREKENSLKSSKAMNDFFSGIFFLRNTEIILICARIALFLGIPSSYICIYIKNGTGIEYFPSMISLWLIMIYFWMFSKIENITKIQKLNFFYELFFVHRNGCFGAVLWILRLFLIFSVIYAFIYRK
jgi:hypothetical protein